VLPYFLEKDIAFLKENVEKEVLEKMEFYTLKNPGKILKEAESVKKAREAMESKTRKRKEKNARKKAAKRARKEGQTHQVTVEGGNERHKKVINPLRKGKCCFQLEIEFGDCLHSGKGNSVFS
jgi:hypothetical protein